MMKKLLTGIILFLISTNAVSSQDKTDIARIVLNAVVLDSENKMPVESKNQLNNKLIQIASAQGIGGSSINPRFILAVKTNVLSKDIIPGPPQMIAMNIEFVFFIGDATDNKIFSTCTINTKGVGINENKAYISAIQMVNTRNAELLKLTETGKSAIASFYTSQCNILQEKVKGLERKQDFEAAIYELMQVPDVSKECYTLSQKMIAPIFQKQIDKQGSLKLSEAKAKWASAPNAAGAQEIATILSAIDPSSTSFKEVEILATNIRKKIESDEKKKWEFELQKQSEDKKIEQQRIESAQKIAIAYYKNQPKTIVYNKIYW
jgi:hypothetical protein